MQTCEHGTPLGYTCSDCVLSISTHNHGLGKAYGVFDRNYLYRQVDIAGEYAMAKAVVEKVAAEGKPVGLILSEISWEKMDPTPTKIIFRTTTIETFGMYLLKVLLRDYLDPKFRVDKYRDDEPLLYHQDQVHFIILQNEDHPHWTTPGHEEMNFYATCIDKLFQLNESL